MRLLRFIGKRLLLLMPQLLGVSLVTFILVRMLPGNPAYVIAGQLATKEQIREVEVRMGLDKPLIVQYLMYVKDLLRGDLGTSWFTSNPVATDLTERFPATLELITLALLISIVLGVSLGVYTALRPKSVMSKGTFFYGLVAGALPDFWVGLLLAFVLYFLLGLLPAPLGRIELAVVTPDRVTGSYLIDSLISGNFEALSSALKHLIMPLVTLVFVYTGNILRMTRSTFEEMMQSGYVHYAKAAGLSEWTVLRYALRNSLPPVLTVVGVMYGYLLGGAVLVETVFSWGGLGQYAVQAIINADYAAMQGFVLVSAVFTMLVYLLVDILYAALDPRIRI